MSLSVLTELPPRADWTGGVNINAQQQDVQFKKTLIYLSVDMLKVFPYNKCVSIIWYDQRQTAHKRFSQAFI